MHRGRYAVALVALSVAGCATDVVAPVAVRTVEANAPMALDEPFAVTRADASAIQNPSRISATQESQGYFDLALVFFPLQEES
jgi:hypothetical protein